MEHRLLSLQAWPMDENATESLLLPKVVEKWMESFEKYVPRVL